MGGLFSPLMNLMFFLYRCYKPSRSGHPRTDFEYHVLQKNSNEGPKPYTETRSNGKVGLDDEIEERGGLGFAHQSCPFIHTYPTLNHHSPRPQHISHALTRAVLQAKVPHPIPLTCAVQSFLAAQQRYRLIANGTVHAHRLSPLKVAKIVQTRLTAHCPV